MTESTEDIFFEDAQGPLPVTDAAVSQISELAQRLKDIRNYRAKVEARLDETKQKETEAEIALARFMSDKGVSSIKLVTGEQVQAEEKLHASIPKECREEAFQWLDDHGHGDLVRSNVSVQFKKGQEEMVLKAIEALKAIHLTPEHKKDVHWKTLTSWVSEQMAQGAGIPMELFGAFIRTVITIK